MAPTKILAGDHGKCVLVRAIEIAESRDGYVELHRIDAAAEQPAIAAATQKSFGQDRQGQVHGLRRDVAAQILRLLAFLVIQHRCEFWMLDMEPEI